MRVSIIEPKGIIWESNIKEAILPTQEGDLCILDFHQPFLARLKSGIIRFSQEAKRKTVGSVNRFPIKDGLASMKGNELKIFAEILEPKC
jgi:F0F1-type ATP synthase epsilon subunit